MIEDQIIDQCLHRKDLDVANELPTLPRSWGRVAGRITDTGDASLGHAGIIAASACLTEFIGSC